MVYDIVFFLTLGTSQQDVTFKHVGTQTDPTSRTTDGIKLSIETLGQHVRSVYKLETHEDILACITVSQTISIYFFYPFINIDVQATVFFLSAGTKTTSS